MPEGPYENMGFPSGVAEELVIKVLRTCDPKSWKAPNGAKKPSDVNNEIMCSTVAQEVEVIAEEDADNINEDHQGSDNPVPPSEISKTDSSDKIPQKEVIVTAKAAGPPNLIRDDYEPPVIPVQQNSETYNGAERDKYWWSQTIIELGMFVCLLHGLLSRIEYSYWIGVLLICSYFRPGWEFE